MSAAELDLSAARDAATRARLDLGAARLTETTTLQAYDEDPAHADAALRARLVRERAERLLTRAEQCEREALDVVRHERRAADERRFAALTEQAGAWAQGIRPILVRLVELDRQASELADALADAVLEQTAVVGEAAQLADALGRAGEAPKAVLMAEALRIARVYVSLTREAEDRPAHDLFAHLIKPDWKAGSRPAWDADLATLNNLNLGVTS